MPDKGWREKFLNLWFSPTDLSGPTLRQNQLKQYFHPEEDVLPQTSLRPTSLTNADPTNIWRSERNQYPTQIDLPAGLAGESVSDFNFPHKLDERQHLLSYGVKPGSVFTEGSDLSRILGLGNSTRSIGIDKQTGRPYLSNYDSWDFKDSPTIDSMSQYMTRGGTPFNVYDRIPFDFVNGKFPNSIYAGQGKDIELPKSIAPTKKVKVR